MFALVLITSLLSSFLSSFNAPIYKERIEQRLHQIDTCAQTGCQR
jgi:hypothetical protein